MSGPLLDAKFDSLEASPLEPGTCEWTLDMDDWNGWARSCEPGGVFCFEEGTAIENGFAFCPYCGKKLVQVRVERTELIVAEDDDAD